MFSTFIKKLVSYKYFYTILFLIIGVILWGGYPRKTELNGTIFGTYYKVIIFAPTFAIQSDSIHQKIIAELQRIDDLYSTYKPSSSLSKLNAHQSVTERSVPSSLFKMIQQSQSYAYQMNDAFDPSIFPLSQFYDFQKRSLNLSLDQVSEAVGIRNIQLVSPNIVLKKNPNVQLDLSSFIKGHAVDQLIRLINEYRITGAYVDIGGEIRASGEKPNNKPWTIGIQSPVDETVISILELNNQAIATSGNYLNYQVINGQKVGHILDPRTLAPIEHDMLSVSVIANSCMDADAFATGLFVMGPDEAADWFSKHTDYAGMLVYIQNGERQLDYFNGFEDMLKPNPSYR